MAEKKTTSVHFSCPQCGREYILPVSGQTAQAQNESPPFLSCDQCSFSIQFLTSVPDIHESVAQCALCKNREFYVQKDFNRKLGLWFVLISGLIALLVMLLTDHRIGIAILLSVSLVDFIIYRYLREVTVCYLCHTIYRGYPKNPEHKPFYLGHEERFKKLRQDWIKGIKG